MSFYSNIGLNKREKEALEHPDILGAGSDKRKHLPPFEKFEVVMSEFGRHKLHSGSGQIVTNPKQAYAIAISEEEKTDEFRRKFNKERREHPTLSNKNIQQIVLDHIREAHKKY